MSDRIWIMVALAVFLTLATSPIWYTFVVAEDTSRPQLGVATEGSRCVMDNPVADHIDLLDRWRNAVVREGDKEPVTVDGRQYKKSLTRGCLYCHSSRQNFCVKCHNYADVHPTCWDCHIETKGD